MKSRKASDATLPPALVPAARLHAAALHLLVFLRKEDEAAGITASRLAALSAIVFEGPISPGDVARIQQVSAPTMSRLIAALEEAGLVRRAVDCDDARGVLLEATNRGRQLMEAARARRLTKLSRALHCLNAEEHRRLVDTLDLFERVVRELARTARSKSG